MRIEAEDSMLPTQQQFEWLTTPKDGKARGTTLLLIDEALRNWEMQQSGAPQTQIQALYLINKACEKYLKKHRALGVSNGKIGGHRQLTLRAQQVKALCAEALAELRRVAPNIRRALGIVELQKRRHMEKLKGGQQ